jgi:cell division protease FtsH
MEKRTKFSVWYYLVVLGAIFFMEFTLFSGSGVKELSYSEFRDLLSKGKIQSVVIKNNEIDGLLKPAAQPQGTTPTQESSPGKISSHTPWRLKLKEFEERNKDEMKREFKVTRLDDKNLLQDLQDHGVDYRGQFGSKWLQNLILNWIVPFGLLAIVWGVLFRRIGKGGASILSIGRSKAKIYAEDVKSKVTFKDVAGIDEAVEEVQEIVSFLKDPNKYTRLGAKLPKGILLVGPPGTGKTLLARAVAGESGVPFFSISGSDFVEMFVGVGAARVRDLFVEAKAKAPCIIFIDELDAVGKSRGKGVYVGGYDERENTLNQLLAEMDGFDPRSGIIIMGATNRPEVLDAALLRPGRFDRQVLVDRPDLNGRMQIFQLHIRGLIMSEDVDIHKLAAETPGFAGAEIANVCNEAALLASRKSKEKVSMSDFQEAIERVVGGLEKKNKLINPRERRIVAYHESGHALVGYFTPGADPVQKVSIVPRGLGALGYTLQTPLEDRYLMTRTELIGKVKGLLGGRASEEVVFGEISTGASNDLEKATKIVRSMLTTYGMSTRLPNMSFVERDEGGFIGQNPSISRYSDKIEEEVDEEMLEIIRSCYEEVKRVLQEHRDKLDMMAKTLLERENIDDNDVKTILGPKLV